MNSNKLRMVARGIVRRFMKEHFLGTVGLITTQQMHGCETIWFPRGIVVHVYHQQLYIICPDGSVMSQCTGKFFDDDVQSRINVCYDFILSIVKKVFENE